MLNVSIFSEDCYRKLRSKVEKHYLNSNHKHKGFALKKIEIGEGEYDSTFRFVNDSINIIDHKNKYDLVTKLKDIEDNPLLAQQFNSIAFKELINYYNSLIPNHFKEKSELANVLLDRISFSNNLGQEGLPLSALTFDRIKVINQQVMELEFTVSEIEFDELRIIEITCIDSDFKLLEGDVIGSHCTYYCQIEFIPNQPVKPRSVLSNRNLAIIIFIALINNGFKYRRGNSGKKGSHQSIYNDLLQNIEDEDKVKENLVKLESVEIEPIIKLIYLLKNNTIYGLPSSTNYKEFLLPSKLFGFQRDKIFNDKIPQFLIDQLTLFNVPHDDLMTNPEQFFKTHIILNQKGN